MSIAADPVRRMLGPCLAAAAAIQAVAAVMFHFAANWWSMTPAVKVGVLDLLLLVCALLAALAPAATFARSAWACAGAVLSGVLFGVHGQIWQTGADSWELFALWTVLAALWALLARTNAVWLLTAGLGMAALWLWGGDAASVELVPTPWQLGLTAAAPVLVLPLAQATGAAPSRWLTPVLLALALAPLTLGGVFALGDGFWPLAVALVTALGILLLLRPRRFGPWPFALGLVSAVVSIESLVMYATVEYWDNGAAGLLSAAALLLVGVAVLARALVVLFAGHPLQARLKTAVSLVVGTGGWIAVGAVLVALAWFLDDWHVDNWSLVLAAMTAAVAVALRLLSRGTGLFLHHLRAANAVAAYLFTLFHLFTPWHEPNWGDAAVAAALLVPVAWLTRSAAAGMATTLVAVAVAALRVHAQEPAALLALVPVLAVLGWAGLARLSSAVRAGAMCLLLAAFALPAIVEFDGMAAVWLARLTAAAAAGGLLAAVLWTRASLRHAGLLPPALLVLAGSLAVPAGGAGLVGLSAASARGGGRLLVALGFAAALWSVSRYYYLLQVPLDQKAVFLAAGAAVTAVAWRLAVGRMPSWRRPAPAALALLAAAAVPAAIEAWDGAAKARVVAEGRQVLLPLRPADPRSLIQGDFMALAYDFALLRGLPKDGGRAALQVDANGVAVAARGLNGGDATPGEVVVRVRPGRHLPRLAPTSFLFPEGTERAWSAARFAIVRVADGNLVLTGLATADRMPIDSVMR